MFRNKDRGSRQISALQTPILSRHSALAPRVGLQWPAAEHETMLSSNVLASPLYYIGQLLPDNRLRTWASLQLVVVSNPAGSVLSKKVCQPTVYSVAPGCQRLAAVSVLLFSD